MEAALKDFLDHAPVFLRQPAGEILYWTEGCRELYGFSSEEALGRRSHELLKTEFPEGLGVIEAKLREAGEWTGRLRHTAKDGRVLWTLSVWRLRRSAEPTGSIVVEQNSDITAHVGLEEQRVLLTRELEHRVKNLLTVVQSLARNSFPNAPAEHRRKFEDRLAALAEANRLLREAARDEADLREVVSEVARTLGVEARLTIEGSDVTISSQHVMVFALAIHELCTNALKHGALSVPHGRVEVSWTRVPNSRQVSVSWHERDGPSPKPPERGGFGTRLIQTAVAGQIGYPVDLRFEPTGLVCEMRLLTAPSPTESGSAGPA